MKISIKQKSKKIPVEVSLNGKKIYGIVIGRDINLVCVLLNTGEYVDVPDSNVKRYKKEIKH